MINAETDSEHSSSPQPDSLNDIEVGDEPPISSSPALASSSPPPYIWDLATQSSLGSTSASSFSMDHEPEVPDAEAPQDIANNPDYFSAMLREKLLAIQNEETLKNYASPSPQNAHIATSLSSYDLASPGNNSANPFHATTTDTINDMEEFLHSNLDTTSAKSSAPPAYSQIRTTFINYSPEGTFISHDFLGPDDGEEADTEGTDSSMSTLVFASPSLAVPASTQRVLPAENDSTESPLTTRMILEPESYASLQERTAASRRLSALYARQRDLRTRKTSLLRRLSGQQRRWRAREYMIPARTISSPLIRRNTGSGTSDTEHHAKRSRTGTKIRMKSSSSSRTQFALEKASSRRAASLKTEIVEPAVAAPPSVDYPQTSGSFPSSSSSSEPSSPVAHFTVPIIAPPPNHVGRLPLSEEASAKLRLMRLREREDKLRRREISLFLGTLASENFNKRERDTERDLWESRLGIGESLRSEVIDWILEVLPVYPDKETSPSPSPRSPMTRANPSSDHMNASPTTSECSASCYGNCSDASSSATLDSSTSPSLAPYRPPYKYSNLHDQLSTSPNTRFHSAHLLTRYCFLIIGSNGDVQGHNLDSSGSDPVSEMDSYSIHSREADFQEGREMVVWDTAVACLALGVKLHRDFLTPLLPVLASEFQALSPQLLSYEDFEISQRDVLSAINYTFGPSPEPILKELWLATPALRELIPRKRDWNCVLKETWTLLYGAIEEPDVLRYPIWLLTTAALIEGLIAALKTKLEYEMDWFDEINIRRRRRCDGPYVAKARRKLRRKLDRQARSLAEGVILDLQVNVSVSEMRLSDCRVWLQGVGK